MWLHSANLCRNPATPIFQPEKHLFFADSEIYQPGKPMQNAYIESFNGRFRDERLSDHWFSTLHEARVLIEAWQKDYNSTRPHSSLGNNPPAEFAAQYHLQPKILLRRVANYREQVNS
jgi:hypothetical protein